MNAEFASKADNSLELWVDSLNEPRLRFRDDGSKKRIHVDNNPCIQWYKAGHWLGCDFQNATSGEIGLLQSLSKPCEINPKDNGYVFFHLANDWDLDLVKSLILRRLETEDDMAGSEDLSKWDEFISWARRFYEWNLWNAQERDYKVEIANNLKRARAAMLDGTEDWIDQLKTAFGGANNLTHWTLSDTFVKWSQANPSEARQLLQILWDSPMSIHDSLREFVRMSPRKDHSAHRPALFSFLLYAIDEYQYPTYRDTAFRDAYKLAGYPAPLKGMDAVEVYEYALGFLDEFVARANSQGLDLKDRLDAQGLVWSITRWGAHHPPISEWSEEDRSAFLRFRGDISDPEDSDDEDDDIEPPRLALSELANQLLLDHPYLQRVERLLEAKGQLIFFGPPGTGKTYVAREMAKFYAGDDGSVELVQFHPSYAYEDFVEGYRPQLLNGQPGFALAEGPLKRIARAAKEQPDAKHMLVIDELNRGNVAKVLGELYFLLEYRDEEISLQYSAEPFRLPENLWIIGTMNTADRSIALIDAALRRRFYFVPFMPDEPPVEGLLRRWLRRENPDFEWVADVVDRANELLGDRHMAIGPSYFMTSNLSEEWVELIWEHSVLPYIAEQFFGEGERLEQFELSTLRRFVSSGPQEDETSGDAIS